MDSENKQTTLIDDPMCSNHDGVSQQDKSMENENEKKEAARKEDPLTSHDECDSQHDKGPDKYRETENKVTAHKEDSLTSDGDRDSQHDEGPEKSMQTVNKGAAQNEDPLFNDHHDGHESEKNNREIMFSDNDSDRESEINSENELKEIIDNLADEIIENLAEETVSKYYSPKTNERTEDDKNWSTVVSSDLDSGDKDNFSLAKLKALNQLKGTLLENTPMSMEEYRLRNQEKLDSSTIHKKFVQSNTESSITDEATPIESDSSLIASTSYTMSNSDGANGNDPGQSTGSTISKSDTTLDRESDSSGGEMIVIKRSRRKKKHEKCEK